MTPEAATKFARMMLDLYGEEGTFEVWIDPKDLEVVIVAFAQLNCEVVNDPNTSFITVTCPKASG